MKKIVLTLVALMSMTLSFAADENSSKVNAASLDNAKYEMNINVYSLGRTLRLDGDTQEIVSYISNDLSKDLAKAGQANGEERTKLYKKAINHNLSYMRSVLDSDQYREYVKLLNVTLNNRGLNANK